jgi:soluble lytic murein transglycosylase-like protein
MTAADILATYNDSIQSYATRFAVDPAFIAAIIQTESSGDPNAYRFEKKLNDASFGLMQVLSGTARNLGYTGEPEGLYDPDTNIMYGTMLIQQLQSRFGSDPAAIYSAYNSGSATAYKTSTQVATNVQRFLGNLSSLASSAVTAVTDATNFIADNPGTSADIGLLLVIGLIGLYLISKG